MIMKIKEEIKEEIKSLINEGQVLFKNSKIEFVSKEEFNDLTPEMKKQVLEFKKDLGFSEKYNKWYGKCIEYVKIFLPSRINDFIELFRKKDAEKRKEMSLLNYGIQDAIHGISNYHVKRSYGTTLLEQQVNILKSVVGIYESSIKSLILEMQEQLFDDEIISARKLIKINLRAAGALAGVVLERHLKTICQNHLIVLPKKNPGINDYNDALKSNNIIELPIFRHIQLLGDLRNLCDHSKKDNPTLDNVTDLVNGTEKIIRTVY